MSVASADLLLAVALVSFAGAAVGFVWMQLTRHHLGKIFCCPSGLCFAV